MKKKLLPWLILIPFISEKGIAQTSKQHSNAKQNKPAVQERMIDIDFKKTAGPLNTFFKSISIIRS